MLDAPATGSSGAPTSPVPVQRKLPSMSLRKSQQQQPQPPQLLSASTSPRLPHCPALRSATRGRDALINFAGVVAVVGRRTPGPAIKKEASPPILSPQGAQQLATAAMASLMPQPPVAVAGAIGGGGGGLLVPGANAVPLPAPGSRVPVPKDATVDKRMQQELLRRQQQDELRLQQMRKQAFDETLSRTGHFVAPVSYHHNFVIPALPNFDDPSASSSMASATAASSSSAMTLEYSGEAI